MNLPADLGVSTHLEAIRKALGTLADRDLLDIGCGESAIPRELATLGASCTGIDPFMPARDWEPAGEGRWRILQAAAEALPLSDGSIDGVLFIFSLHHVPATALAGALREARRVLNPRGFLYIAEPLPAGDFNDLISIFHDEREVRFNAQRALNAASPLFGSHATSAYTARRRFDDFASFADLMRANTRFNGYSEADVMAPAVEKQFHAITGRSAGIFDQPVKVDLLR